MKDLFVLLGNEQPGGIPLLKQQPAAGGHASGAIPPGLGSILLVEQDAELRESRRLLLSLLNRPVLAVGAYADVCKLPADSNCCLVAIDTRPNGHEAAQAAVHVRRTWPTAKILLLGPPSREFDDPLYDDALDACCNPAGVVTAARRLLRNDYRLLNSQIGSQRDGTHH